MPKRARSEFDSEVAAVRWLSEICTRSDSSCPLNELKDLVQRFPNAIRVEDAYGCSPLHHACENGWADEIIQVLIESWPQSVQLVTECGSRPLNYACHGNSPLTVIRTLVEAYPDALHWPDKFGRLPLHIAGNHGCSVEVIEFLIKCQPESVRCRNCYGPCRCTGVGDQVCQQFVHSLKLGHTRYMSTMTVATYHCIMLVRMAVRRI